MKDVLIYNALGEQLIRLAQWDRDVYVSIEDADITKSYPIHFFNKNSDRAYAVESTYEGGKLKNPRPPFKRTLYDLRIYSAQRRRRRTQERLQIYHRGCADAAAYRLYYENRPGLHRGRNAQRGI